jgi:competence protein ComEC
MQAQILKISHHGSHTATSSQWLQQVRPQYAVLSCGQKNRYGHPHQVVMERLKAHRCKILDTRDGMQTIVIRNNGQIQAQSGITRWWRGPWQHKTLSF